jgi:hypothetical protein
MTTCTSTTVLNRDDNVRYADFRDASGALSAIFPFPLAAPHVISASEPILRDDTARNASLPTARTSKTSDGFANRVLDHSETAHFFEVEDGSEKFCGSTSGLPLL